MNIMFIVPYVPNLIRIRPFNLVRGLAKAGHKITVCTLWSEESERADIAQLEDEGIEVYALSLTRWNTLRNCIAALPSRTPLQAAYCWQPEMARLLGRIVSNGKKPFDVIHVEHLRGARYGIYIKDHHPDLPVVWDSVDCISYLFRQAAGHSKSLFGRLVTLLELKKTRDFEGWLPSRFDHVLMTSAIDKEALLALSPNTGQFPPVSVLPNGVDTKYFHPDESVIREPSTLILSGKMSYHANVTMALYFVNEVLPLIWSRQPRVRLIIVGKDPPAKVRTLGNHPQINVTGTVDNMRPYLQRATVAVVPLVYGAGVQNKVLEAMACATPVVATPGAVAALNVVPERDLLIGRDAQEFAAQVIKLIESPIYQRRIGDAGRKFVERYHDWKLIIARLEGIYHEVINHKSKLLS